MPQATQWQPPQVPDATQQEGARWRFHRPTSEAVAQWFATVPLDEELETRHQHYVGGVVLIGQDEKVKYTKPDGGLYDRYERVYTPYMQIGTRVAYFRRLAECRELIPVIRPSEVPRTTNRESIYFNANMPDGLWWHCVSDGSSTVRYLCATYEVAMYEPTSYAAKLRGANPLPMLSGSGTKQVSGGVDPNGLMKAQTGAIGRALGVAGILVVGTGIATAEDMQEFSGLAAPMPSSDNAQLPAPSELPDGDQPVPQYAADELLALRSRAMEVQTRLQESAPEAWREFIAWYQERARVSSWAALGDVPFEALKGVVSRMERMLAEAETANAATEVRE